MSIPLRFVEDPASRSDAEIEGDAGLPAYRPARLRAAREAKSDLRGLPLDCPFSLEQIMQTRFEFGERS